MPVRRLAEIPGFAIDLVAAAAGEDPSVLRLENLDTNLPPPEVAVQATRQAVGKDEHNSYLPFTGSIRLRKAIARHLARQSGQRYDPETEIVATCGGTSAMLSALFAVTDPGDAVILTDPTYAGMINRVRLVGGLPAFVPLFARAGGWRLDLDALDEAASGPTRAVFLMNPSVPSGAVLDNREWEAIGRLCVERGLWLLYNAAMERIVFDGRPILHPAALPGMRDRTLVMGTVSKEYRMIGWRIGWIAGPRDIMADVARVAIYNVVTPPGITQPGAAAALESATEGVAVAVAEWQRRRDVVLAELRGLPVVPPAGGWSLLLDVGALGHDSYAASRLLLEQGRVAATPMRDWGPSGDRYVRLVFSNEPVERLTGLGDRVRGALGA